MKLIPTIFLVVSCIFQILGSPLKSGNVAIVVIQFDDIYFQIVDGDKKILEGTLGEGLNLTQIDSDNIVFENNDTILTIKAVENGFNFEWISNDTSTILQDCINLNDTVQWFGGQERYYAKWPIQDLVYNGEAYRSTRIENGAIAERYWLNSLGAYIAVEDNVPLFLKQNSVRNNTLCFVAEIAEPYLERSRVVLNYTIITMDNATQAHQHAIDNFLGKPTGYPNERIIRYPIWTTWAKYKSKINDEIVRSFAKDIADHGFIGQLEIDDAWETCYGTITFNDEFADINNTVKFLKDLNFTVSLWTHPFVNDNCAEITAEGREKGYFVKTLNGSDMTSWWNSNSAHHIDFTNPEAAKWYVDRLKLIQEKHGIDSFKFDAGENDWAPQVAKLSGDMELAPNSLSEAYLRTVAQFGDLIEVRTGSRTQDLPIFVRIQDKDSRWGLDNGLHNLITTLLQMNLNGYTLVLPDMIGGNGYGIDLPTPELLVRWTQANTFMPAMQFSYLPWDLKSDEFDSLGIVKKFVDLHYDYSDMILEALQDCVDNGTPVNGPIWWIDPTNEVALTVNDEYLLGERILVAPVIIEGATSRDVVLPQGSWKDGNNGSIYEGPVVLQNYPAPIDVLPYFLKQ